MHFDENMYQKNFSQSNDLVSSVLWHINLHGLGNAKATFVEQMWLLGGGDERLHTIPMSINLKGKILVWLEFKLIYNDFTV